MIDQIEISPQIPALFTVQQFSEKYPAFSQSSLRNLIFLSKARISTQGVIPGNGFGMAIIRVRRKILINEHNFFKWITDQNQIEE